MAMTRITTNMVMRNYQNNLTSTLGGLESSRKQVETGRRFAQSYEDPTSSARAAILERRYSRTEEYLENVANTQKWQDSQEDVVMTLSDIARKIEKEYSVQAVSDTNAQTGRSAFAQALEELQRSMVASLNAKYGDTYIMAGNKGKEPPFTLNEQGELLYRGVNVDDTNAQADLDKLAKEHSYVDLGFGLTFGQNDEIVASSAFDSAMPGINVVGYGKTADGTSKNLIILTGQMAELLRAEENGGTFNPEAYKKLWDQFSEGSENLRDQMATIGTKTQQLEATQNRLENEKLAITQQFDKAVNIEPAEAIMNYSWAQYAYNTALKVGTSIITPSLLDFMK